MINFCFRTRKYLIIFYKEKLFLPSLPNTQFTIIPTARFVVDFLSIMDQFNWNVNSDPDPIFLDAEFDEYVPPTPVFLEHQMSNKLKYRYINPSILPWHMRTTTPLNMKNTVPNLKYLGPCRISIKVLMDRQLSDMDVILKAYRPTLRTTLNNLWQ